MGQGVRTSSPTRYNYEAVSKVTEAASFHFRFFEGVYAQIECIN
jgi:hypothetical protein